MIKLWNNIFFKDLELKYATFFTIKILLDVAVTTDGACS